jgi:hypothetical protein
MGIEVYWQDENGRAIASVADSRGGLAALLRNMDFQNSKCMAFIDPYGDTVFNQVQIPVLIDEMAQVSSSSCSRETQEHVESIIELARKAVGSPHTYLKFVGD